MSANVCQLSTFSVVNDTQHKQNGCDPEMSVGTCRQEVLYVNYENKTSKEIKQDTEYLCSQSSETGRNKQILTVDPFNFHSNRLSHQYLNSSVTGQSYPDILPVLDTKMIFTAATVKDSFFNDVSKNQVVHNSQGSPTQYYHNRNVFRMRQ